MSRCRFCGAPVDPLYSVSIAGQTRQLQRCRRCLACGIDELIPETVLQSYYEGDYFHQSDWEIAKSRLLATDYARKCDRHALLSSGVFHRLEIGASFGFFADLVHRRTGQPTHFLEVSRECRTHIQNRFPALVCRGGTLDDLPPQPIFDRVFGFHLLEHLQSVESFLCSLALRMKPGGLAFFLTPNAASIGFFRHGLEWGWSCPNQHCSFLSPKIPAAFYQSAGFSLESVYSMRPAHIHTPSGLLVALDRFSTKLLSNRTRPLSMRSLPAKVVGRALDTIRLQFVQNRPAARLLGLERMLHLIRGPQQHDELVLLLRRT